MRKFERVQQAVQRSLRMVTEQGLEHSSPVKDFWVSLRISRILPHVLLPATPTCILPACQCSLQGTLGNYLLLLRDRILNVDVIEVYGTFQCIHFCHSLTLFSAWALYYRISKVWAKGCSVKIPRKRSKSRSHTHRTIHARTHEDFRLKLWVSYKK